MKRGPKEKEFKDLKGKRQGQLVNNLMENATSMFGNRAQDVIVAAAGVILKNPFQTAREQRIEANVKKFCSILLIKHRGKGAALLTEGMPLQVASILTGVSTSSISEGRKSLEKSTVQVTQKFKNPKSKIQNPKSKN